MSFRHLCCAAIASSLTFTLSLTLTQNLAGQEASPARTGTLSTTAPAVFPLVLPTDNDALLRGDNASFYMYVDRIFENQVSTPWEGGGYGYVRGPVRNGADMVLMAFHEGIDIAPTKRDAAGEPIDEVRAISPGKVVHCSQLAGASNYGRYIVIQHDLGEGSFFSLYAHLSKILVQPGQDVTMRTPIGIMGYTGSGLNQRRAHVHLEVNLMLSSRFDDWHAKNFRPSPNKHGNYNGINLSGVNVAQLYLEHQKNPALSLADFIRKTEPVIKIVVPRKGELEILKHYPWLGQDVSASSPSPSWE
ncbi:MAG TPA: M23 family metallopeptidase, partial [Verrucomicrobium sp.]|nr:M23 family metallopeptidase [Verrucomicrobium sp.]